MEQRKFVSMKQTLLYLMIGLLFATYSCKEDDESVKTYQVKVKLVYPNGYQPAEDVKVTLKNKATEVVFEKKTNAAGIVEFEVTAGNYEVSATESRTVDDGAPIHLNGSISDLVVADPWTTSEIELKLSGSTSNKIIIKEVYNGGCQKDDGSGAFSFDSYVILYNNFNLPVSLENVCLGMVLPYNAQGTNSDYINGKLSYEGQGWIPAGQGIWTFKQAVSIDPGKQIVIALKNAIDNTLTYSKSINFSNPEYYCTFDIEVYPNANYYPAPSAAIPVDHYLKAYHYGTGNAWSFSTTSPAFFIFATEGTTPEAFANNADLTDLYGGSATQVRKKLPVDWVLDGIEVFNYGNAKNQKRLTPTIDAGYVELFNQHGFTLYRNVDKEATEALAENTGKIVYNYNLGTENITIGDQVINGTTDPSGIDAEASIRNGARIIYKDTNNSTNDFHQRSKASLRN
jgi:hypothetical protein